MEQLGTCAGFCACYKVPHRKKLCTGENWQPVSAPAEPAEYTCPRCGSKISTHICMKAEPVAGETKQCELCGHSLLRNEHGFDQNDGWMDGDKLIHSGRCSYCKECFPRPAYYDSGPAAPAVAAPAEGKQQIKRDLGQTVAEENAMTSKKLLHEYLSTACYHGFHEACRIHCKFCSEKCSCKCHTEEDARRIVEAVNGRS